MGKKITQGITVKKEDNFSEWYTQLIQKADLADYTKVSGCIVFKPNAWAIWEKIRDLVDVRIKKLGVKNANFPLFIPESLLTKEEEHVEGFAPEVAWVTHGGNSELNEKLAVRPTSEAIMYDSYAKWIRSWRDLPLKLNQWSNVVRWEFSHAVPFFRTREFHFNEGHTAFATEKESLAEGEDIVKMYSEILNDYMAIPHFVGDKTDKEKFAGAVFSRSLESYLPNGKAIQGPIFHHDGQKFAKAYGIKFVGKDGKEDYAWQNTWAISTRMLGVMFALHSDNKGLVLPPKMAANQVVVLPLMFDKDPKGKEILSEAAKLVEGLEEFDPILDDRSEYSPGWKFNEWELKGIPVRVEIGPRDLAKGKALIFRRDESSKEEVDLVNVVSRVRELLTEIQDNLFSKADKLMKDNTVEASSHDELVEAIKNGKIALINWCGDQECLDLIKDETGGAKALNIPLDRKSSDKCIWCSKEGKSLVYVGKSY